MSGRADESLRESRWRRWAPIVLVLLLALALRLPTLGDRPYWQDEVHNLVKAQHIDEVLLTGELVSNHPPGVPVLIWLWRAFGLGGSEFSMRLLPVLLGLGGVWAVYLAGSALHSRRAGLLAALLVAVSPFHVLHSQDLKEYILLPFTGTVMVYLFYRASEENTWRLWLGYGVMAGIACYSEAFVLPMLIVINLWFLAQWKDRRDRLPGWVAGNILGAALFVPWLPIMVSAAARIGGASDLWWVPAVDPLRVAFYLKTIAFGYSDWEPWFKAALGVFLALWLAGTWALWRRGWREATLVLGWFLGSMAITALISLAYQQIFLVRAMLPFAMGAYVLAGAGLAVLRPRGLRIAAAAVVALLMVPSLYQRYADIYAPIDFPHRPGIHPPKAYDETAAHILAHWQDGDVVVQNSISSLGSLRWYGLLDKPTFVGAATTGFSEVIRQGNPANNDTYFYRNIFPEPVRAVTEGYDRVWYVFEEYERKYLWNHQRGTPTHAALLWMWMEGHFTQVDHVAFEGLELFLYERTGPEGVRVVRRDADDGLSAEVTVERPDGSRTVHTVARPDLGLVATPPAARTGALALRFADATRDPEAIPLAGGRSERRVAFVIANGSDEDVTVALEVVASAAFVPVPSLWEQQPESDTWLVTPASDPGSPHGGYTFALAASATPCENGAAALQGEVALPAGRYRPYTRVFAYPGGGAVTAALGGRAFLGPDATDSAGGPAQWRWVAGPVLPVEASPVDLTVAARPVAGREGCYVGLGYTAFVPDAWLQGGARPLWESRRVVPAGGAAAFEAVAPEDAARLDILVWSGEPGWARFYHIHTRLDDAAGGQATVAGAAGAR